MHSVERAHDYEFREKVKAVMSRLKNLPGRNEENHAMKSSSAISQYGVRVGHFCDYL
jgi:hypothetical protein